MINEDFCSYEVAKLLKEKRFDEQTRYAYTESGKADFSSLSRYWNQGSLYACPTHQMAMKWLRKVHNQHVQIKYFHGAYQEFEYVVINTFNGKAYHEPVSFSSYEEAVEAALKYTLENLI